MGTGPRFLNDSNEYTAHGYDFLIRQKIPNIGNVTVACLQSTHTPRMVRGVFANK